MADEPDPRQRLADNGYSPALWLPGGQHFLAPGGDRVVTLDQALAELDERENAAADTGTKAVTPSHKATAPVQIASFEC